MDAILEARNAERRRPPGAAPCPSSTRSPWTHAATGALVINALDDVLEKRFLDTVRAVPHAVDEGVAPGRFAACLWWTARLAGNCSRARIYARVPARRTCASCCASTTSRTRGGAALRRRRHDTFNQCERRDTSDAFRGRCAGRVIDGGSVGAATPGVAGGRPRRRRLRPRALPAAVSFTRRPGRRASSRRGRGGGTTTPRPQLRRVGGCPVRGGARATEDAAPELLAACVLAAVGVDAAWVLGKTAVFFGNAAAAAEARQRSSGPPATRRAERASSPYKRMRGSGAAAAAAAAHAAEDVVLALGDALARDGRRRRPMEAPAARARARRSAVLADGGCNFVGGRVAGGGRARGRDAGERGGGGPRRGGAPRGELRGDPRRARPTRHVDPDALAIEPAAAGLRKAPARDRPPPAPAGPQQARRPRRSAGSAPTAAGGGPSSATPCWTPRARRDDAVPGAAAPPRRRRARRGRRRRPLRARERRQPLRPPRRRPPTPEPGRCHRGARGRPRQAERDALVPAKRPTTGRRHAISRAAPLFLTAPSDAAPVVRRLARGAFVEARATVLGDGDRRALSGRRGALGPRPRGGRRRWSRGASSPTSATYGGAAAPRRASSRPTRRGSSPGPPPRGRRPSGVGRLRDGHRRVPAPATARRVPPPTRAASASFAVPRSL